MTIFSSAKRDDVDENARTSYFNLPPLDVSIAFPQATPASIFPPCTSDYFHFDDLLTLEEQTLRKKVRECMEKEIAPIMTEYWEKAKFPFHVIPKLGALHIAGGTIKGYGCPGLSITGSAVATAEVARVDASCSTFILVHSSLAMLTIALCGSEEQKEKYLPSLAQLKTVGCWALTEPEYGSDASALNTTATKVQGGWVLEGQKRWIGNSTFADLLVIFARNTTSNQINGFIVKKDAPGLTATKIENKIGLRMVQNGDILLKRVFVGDEDRLPGVDSFQDTSKILAVSRITVAWQPIGLSMGVYDMCHRYLKERKQFGAPLAAFQINQQKLVQMLGNIQAMVLVGWRLCKLYENGKMTPGHASLGKSWITLKARETAAIGRELLGGNGILADFLVAKAFCDLEPIYTYEGTYDINSLVTGRRAGLLESIVKFASRKVVPQIGRECGFFDWVDPEPCDHGKVILNLLKQKHDHLVAEVKRCQRMVEIEVGKVKSEMDKEIAKIKSELEKEGQQLKSVMADEIAGYRKEIEIGQIRFRATKKNYETMLVCSWIICGLCLCIIWFGFSFKSLQDNTVG